MVTAVDISEDGIDYGIPSTTIGTGTVTYTGGVGGIQAVEDPCTQSSALINNQAFVAKLNYLKSIMNVPGETTELMEPNGTFQQQTSTVNGGGDQNFSPGYFSGSVGFMHNHGKGAGILSVFSPADLASFYTIITQGNVWRPLNYTYALVNQDGQSYLLIVSNMAQFTTWAGNYTTNGAPVSAFAFLYNQYINSNNTDTANEDALTLLLQSTNSGLTLMKANSTNTAWSTMVRNSNGSYSIVPCPSN